MTAAGQTWGAWPRHFESWARRYAALQPTCHGPLDILSDAAGAPAYATLRDDAGQEVLLEGVNIRVASLDHLIAMKEVAGRTKDILAASEYRVISDELRRPLDEP